MVPELLALEFFTAGHGVVSKFIHSLQTTIYIIYNPSPKAGPLVIADITPASSFFFNFYKHYPNYIVFIY
jgi:hypothetical protein